MADIATLRKTFTSAYVVDRGKLSRILTIISDRMSELTGTVETTFTLKLRSGREIILHNVQEVLALDNSVKNPVRELQIESVLSEADARASLRFDSDNKANVHLIVSGANQRWATELFAELEEQVERTLTGSWAHFLRRGGIEHLFSVGATLVTFLAIILIPLARPEALKNMESAQTLYDRAVKARTMDEKVQILFEKAVRDLRKDLPQTKAVSPVPPWYRRWLTWRTFFLSLPVVIVLATLAYLVIVCYPWTVFAWGDHEQYYNDVIARRKSLWTVIIMSLLLGVITNLFVISLPVLR